MNFTLTEPLQYAALKDWFIDNNEKLTRSVNLTAAKNMLIFDLEQHTSKGEIRISRRSKEAHEVLTDLYNELKTKG